MTIRWERGFFRAWVVFAVLWPMAEIVAVGQAMIEMWLILAVAFTDLYLITMLVAGHGLGENPRPDICFPPPYCRYRCYCLDPRCSLDCCY